MSKFQNMPYRWRQVISYSLVAAISAALTAAILIFFGNNTIINYSGKGNYGQGIAKLEQVYGVIQEQYIGDADEEAMIDAAAQALVMATGDQWSYYMNAKEYAYYKQVTSNTYVGIGVTVNTDEPESGFLIEKVEANSGAEAAGLKIGDWITHVDGVSVVGIPTSEARDKIRGQEGTTVELTIKRDGVSTNVVVVRGTNTSAVAKGQMLDNGIGLVTITNFNERCQQETVKVIEDLKGQGAKALIFDVRNNPGGYKSEMVALLDFLLPEGVLFRSESYNGQTEVDNSDAGCLKMPMAVLINGESYSAAEFFAAALVEYDWALTVGENTTGKGRFQVDIELSDGSAVHLSVGKFYTPKGVDLSEAKGIAPTFEVELNNSQKEALKAGTLAPEEDPQVQKAAEELLKKLK